MDHVGRDALVRQEEQSSAEFRRYGLALKFEAEVGRALMESTLPTLSHKRERMGQPAP